MIERCAGRSPASGAGSREKDLRRIQEAIADAAEIARGMLSAMPDVAYKPATRRDPVTNLDFCIDRFLHERLPDPGEAWLSEESRDDRARLRRQRVWIVDPVDGTRELLEGIPEWCISVALVEDGQAVAGGIANPATGETYLGAAGLGVTLNGRPVAVRPRPKPGAAVVLASRSELRRGQWSRWTDVGIKIRPLGSVAYKLARVSAGLADATWTFVPKHEWDVAAGVALVTAAGGTARTPDGRVPVFNRRRPIFSGLAAFSACSREVLEPLASAGAPDGRGFSIPPSCCG
jgi:myo-inositol-1(or 4)-monophosphatase